MATTPSVPETYPTLPTARMSTDPAILQRKDTVLAGIFSLFHISLLLGGNSAKSPTPESPHAQHTGLLPALHHLGLELLPLMHEGSQPTRAQNVPPRFANFPPSTACTPHRFLTSVHHVLSASSRLPWSSNRPSLVDGDSQNQGRESQVFTSHVDRYSHRYTTQTTLRDNALTVRTFKYFAFWRTLANVLC